MNSLPVIKDKMKAVTNKLCITCGECGRPTTLLTKNHMMKEHGLTKAEYIKKHPEHADIYYWGNLTFQNSTSRKAHIRDGGVIKWRKKEG